MKTRLFTVLMCASLLVACRTVGPNYKRPVVRTPETFRGDDPSPSADPASLADLKWFELFKDERLQQLIRDALEENYDLRDAVVRVDAARANLGITRADQVPTLNITSDVTSSRTSANGAIPRF